MKINQAINKQSLVQELSILALFDKRAKLKINHDPFIIQHLEPFEVLSTSYRKVKEVMGFKYHDEFYSFLAENGLCCAITEVAFTNLDVDKSFLDDLKPILGEEQVENLKKKPSAKILFDAKLKISSHLIICKKLGIQQKPQGNFDNSDKKKLKII